MKAAEISQSNTSLKPPDIEALNAQVERLKEQFNDEVINQSNKQKHTILSKTKSEHKAIIAQIEFLTNRLSPKDAEMEKL